ncbi:MAG TPA: copper homeostasis protein CutC [Puia sp.]|jgi:copper homeostasis protein|nr:copper homeostasis protein CutC [Puia sp.]
MIEICCFNVQSVLIAQRAGAHRVELCADAAVGGTTQSLGVIKTAREKLHIQLCPIIRPRGGDFLFSEEELDIMMNDVLLCKQIGCDGVVIGMLNEEGTIDKKSCGQLVQLAYPLGVTFHRAFDWTADPTQALEDIIEIGCERILTSGQHPTAMEGAELIAQLIQQADDRIIIMPGSGIRSANIIELAQKTKAQEFHSSARTQLNSNMQYINANMKDDMSVVLADENEIKNMVELLAQNSSAD